MRIQFVFYYKDSYQLFGSDGREDFGNYLFYPSKLLKRRVETLGHECVVSEADLHRAECVVFTDWGKNIMDVVRSLPNKTRKILISVESKLYVPWLHCPEVMLSDKWDAVLTYNRGFIGPRIIHIDFPISPDLRKRDLQQNNSPKGVAVATLKNDFLGDAIERNRLYASLAKRGEIDIYGHGWTKNQDAGIKGAISDKIFVTSAYRYALVVENHVAPGWVTEKIGDSILAGLPTIYWGDPINAERRFGKVFVPLANLTETAFYQAKHTLLEDYETLRENVLISRLSSDKWCDSSLDAMARILTRIQ